MTQSLGTSDNVPAVDSAGNNTVRDVAGNKSDTHSGTSLFAMAEKTDEHFHSAANVCPTLLDGIVVTATANDWTDLGAFAVIAATNAITVEFDIHWVNIEAISANGEYELVLYSGADASEVEIGRVRFGKTTNQDGPVSVPITTPLIAANTQIKAKVASNNAVANTVTISIGYHPYA